MRSRLADLRLFHGGYSDRETVKRAKADGYLDGEGLTIDDYRDALREAGYNYGLSLDHHVPYGDESDDRPGRSGFDPHDRGTWAKAVWRVPAHYRCLHVWDYCLSTGGPEDGFLIVAGPKGRAVAGYYYESDWGTFARRRLTAAQLATVADFLGLEDLA